MRRNDWRLKLLISLPVLALACVLVWVCAGQIKNSRGYGIVLAEESFAGGNAAGEPGTELAGGDAAAGDSAASGRSVTGGKTGGGAADGNAASGGSVTDGKTGGGAADGNAASGRSVTDDKTAAAAAGMEGNSGTEEEQASSIRLLFGGDILLSDHVLRAYEQAGGIEGVLDEGYRSEILKADLFMANEEFPFSSRGSAAPDKQFTFRLPPERVSLFQEIGLDIVALANNHALDFGRDALEDTCRTLDGAGIRYVGAGENLDRAKRPEIIEVKGQRIGFIAASRVLPEASWAAGGQTSGMLSAYDPAILLSEIGAARPQCDYLIVYIHWGIEREETPEDYQVSLGRRMIDAGADLVIGSHPHVLQGVEFYQGKPVFYSLGNFIFGSNIPRTALLWVELPEEGAPLQYRLVPGTSGAGFTHMLTAPEKKEEFYSYMESISPGLSIDEEGYLSPKPSTGG